MYGAPPSGSRKPNEKTTENIRIGMSGVRNVHSTTPAVPAYVLLRSWRASELRARRLVHNETISPMPVPCQRRDVSARITMCHSLPNSYAINFLKRRLEALARRVGLAYFTGGDR